MFGRLLPLRDDVTHSASIGPTDSGRPSRRLDVADMVSNTSELEAQPIRQPAYAQLLFSSTDRYVSQTISRIPIGNNATSTSATLNPAVSGTATLTLATTPTSNFALNEQVLVQAVGSVSAGFEGVITTIAGGGTILTISNIKNISGTFPFTSTWTIYPTLGAQSPSQLRLFGTIIPRSPGPQYATPASASSFVLQYPQYLLQGHFTRLAISQLQFQWNIPTINDNNNSFQIQYGITIDGDTTYTIETYTIPDGWYTPVQLASAIQTAVLNGSTGADSSFTATFTNGVFVFTVNAVGYQFEFVFDTFNAVSIENNFLLTIGMNYNSNYTFATSITSGPPPMTYTRWIDITSTELTKYQRVKDATTANAGSHPNSMVRVYCNPPSTTSNAGGWGGGVLNGLPFYITYDFPTPKYIKWNGKDSLLNFDISCFDEFGQPMFWAPEYATEFQFTLLASES